MYTFLYNSFSGVLSRNPRLTVEEQVREAVILDVNISLHGAEVLMRGLVKSLNAELEDWRVYSLSKRYDNLNLWAKYAGITADTVWSLRTRDLSLAALRK